ncbi:UNVERIFIED_CONTAM: hypothetical protein PYX00_002067 [Menopon gallinae]|uniref:Uncharacterized protein n=1 Tax=Menopon gallinae TaxID=328185 RepID=A0AAW2IFC3_9NEOP
MNRLSQSEKSNTCNVGSLMNTPGDLPHRLEKNLGKYKTGLKSAPEDRAYFRSGNNSNLLINQSFRSLHIFPMDNGIKSVKISSDALFKNQLSGRNRDYLWWQTNMIKSTSVGDMGNTNLMTPVRSIDYPRQTVRSAPAQAVTRETARRTTDRVGREITEIPCTNTTIRFEVPEIPLGSEPIMVSVESANELGGYTEVGNPSHSSGSADSIRTRRTRDPSRISLSEVKTLLDAEESLANQSKNDLELSNAPSSLSISILELGQELTALKPVVVQEITWNFSYLPVPTPVTHVHYRNERNLVFERMETQVLFVAMPTIHPPLSRTGKAPTVRTARTEECEVFENCVATIDPHEANSLEDNFGNSASDEDPNGVKVLKKAESLSARKEDDQWDSFPSGSSSEFCDAEKRRVDIILQRPNRELDRHSENFPWLHQLPDPYESNPPDDDTDNGDGPKKQNDNSQTRHLRYSWGDLSCRNTPKQKVTGFAPHIFRYLSSDASTGSVNDSNTYNSSIHAGNISNSPKGNALATVEKSPEIPQHKIEIPMQDREPKVDSQKYDEDEDSSSTSSFKSSNDYSDMSELQNTNSPRKKSMSRSYLLGKLFHELRHFRKYLLRRKSLKRKPAAPDDRKEFEEALTELPDDGKALVGDQKEKVDEAIAVNTLCVDEVTLGENQAFPRKVFKTSFRGKESVTELMIDLKDVCISEVSDISVEKRKLSTDHTKISIVIKKQNDCNRDGRRTGKPAMVSPKSSYHSLHEVEGLRLRDRGDSGEEESDDEDDDDYKSAGSSVRSNSSENMDRNLDEQFRRMCDNIGEPRKKSSSYNRHRFDYYKRMDNASSVDSLNLNGRGVLVSSKYEKELAPLKKALTDMQLRIRNIQRNSYTTSDEYYERALRMAKMSVGYCQSCKSKAVIPEDPLGIYRKFIPRSWLRSQYGKQREYYFRTTSSTNSSFYSVQSSNSHNKFCRLSSSSSLFANGLRRSGGSSMRDTPTPPVPIFISRNTNF